MRLLYDEISIILMLNMKLVILCDFKIYIYFFNSECFLVVYWVYVLYKNY